MERVDVYQGIIKVWGFEYTFYVRALLCLRLTKVYIIIDTRNV